MNYCTLSLITVCLFLSMKSSSQKTTKSRTRFPVLYINSGGGFLGKGWSAKTGASILVKKNSGLSVSYRHTSFTADQLPADYDPGSGFFGSKPTPKDEFSVISIGYINRISKAENKFQLLGEVGLSSVKHQYRTFTKNTSSGSGWFSAPSNYIATEHKKNQLGFYISPQANYLFKQWIGMQLTALVTYSETKTIAGAELSLIVGKLR